MFLYSIFRVVLLTTSCITKRTNFKSAALPDYNEIRRQARMLTHYCSENRCCRRILTGSLHLTYIIRLDMHTREKRKSQTLLKKCLILRKELAKKRRKRSCVKEISGQDIPTKLTITSSLKDPSVEAKL